MCITLMQTGEAQIKPTHYHNKGPDSLRFPRILLERRWSEPIPINVYLIEHPEGYFLVDTGETAEAMQPGYYSPIYRQILKVSLTSAQEVGSQLKELGIAPGDVRMVILTHLHADHAGGLHHFPKAEIVVSRREYQQPFGALPNRWPNWFAPKLVDFTDVPFGSFPQSYSLTKANDLFMVPTAGHTPGHSSVILKKEGISFFFAGDASFTEDQLLNDEISGISSSPKEARLTLQLIREYIKQEPTVYLPAHDHAATRRLSQKILTRL